MHNKSQNIESVRKKHNSLSYDDKDSGANRQKSTSRLLPDIRVRNNSQRSSKLIWLIMIIVMKKSLTKRRHISPSNDYNDTYLSYDTSRTKCLKLPTFKLKFGAYLDRKLNKPIMSFV